MSRQNVLLGTLGAILLVALWWMFLYSPGQEDIEAVEAEIAAAEAETVNLRARVARLEAIRAAAPETEAAIANLRAIVPDNPSLPSALRQLVAAADDAGVEISALNTTRPGLVEGSLLLHQLNVTMNVEGSYFQLVDFIRRIEDPSVTSRGFLFDGIAMTPAEYPTLTVAVNGRMFAVLDPVPDPTVVEEPVSQAEAVEDDDVDAVDDDDVDVEVQP